MKKSDREKCKHYYDYDNKSFFHLPYRPYIWCMNCGAIRYLDEYSRPISRWKYPLIYKKIQNNKGK